MAVVIFAVLLISMALCAIVNLRRYLAGGVCRSRTSLRGVTVLITGANRGIGEATTLDLARRRARVIMACRDTRKGHRAAEEIRKQIPDADIVVKELDLASFKSINRFCDDLLQTESCIHVLINNAGVFYHPEVKTEDGFDTTFQVNYLGPYLLTNRLLNLLERSAPSRVIVVSSWMHSRGRIDFKNLNGETRYDKHDVYCTSKLAVVMFARELSRHTGGSGVCVYATHPGVAHTEAGRYMRESMSPVPRILTRIFGEPIMWLLAKTAMQGAQTIMHCVVSEKLFGISGKYYADCKEVPYPDVEGVDEGVEKKLWEISERWTGLTE